MLENLQIDLCVEEPLEENDIRNIDEECIRKLRDCFVDEANEDEFPETLISSMLYVITILPMIVSMLCDLFPKLYDNCVGCLISGLADIMGRGFLIEFTFSDEESERLLMSMIYLLTLFLWITIYHFGKRREGVRHRIYYYDRHVASLSFFALFLFYIAGYIVCQLSDTVLSVAVIISLISAENLDQIELKTVLNLLLWLIRFVIVSAAMIYPIYLMIHYQNVDKRVKREQVNKEAEETLTSDDEYKTYVVRVHKRLY